MGAERPIKHAEGLCMRLCIAVNIQVCVKICTAVVTVSLSLTFNRLLAMAVGNTYDSPAYKHSPSVCCTGLCTHVIEP